ncbi:MAG: hypothetical protein A3D31_02925 [Candidatus Fluviicola riflensis]|nr:MAG: hypothetical protein CHH17_12110 [Candidatus Fluviicola riflensis]OGS78941.1 MAG: hypothetical protein A3D31_02925 [Candidatus Fluviicola riflensis]
MVRLLLILCFIPFSSAVFAQLLKGQITDTFGEPIPFARVGIENTSYGTIANAQGNFQLELTYNSYTVIYSAMDYETISEKIEIQQDVTLVTIVLKEEATELEETVITVKTKKNLGKEIMKQVIDKRSYFRDQLSEYQCNTYCFTSLEKEEADSIKTDSIISRKKMNLVEWNGTSYYKANNRYKDVITAFIDLTEPAQNTGSVTVVTGGMDDEILEPSTGMDVNPYLFVNGIKDADINIFDNLIEAPGLSLRPLISPMAYNAFLYYNFYVESSFYEENQKIYQIRVEPRFREEALFEGSLYIRDTSWELVSYALTINRGALTYFREMHLVADFEKMGSRIVPTRREYVYLIKEGKKKIHGNVRVMHSGYGFEIEDNNGKFWLESTVYTPEAFNRDSAYWSSIRPFHLKQEEINFIHQQDSIAKYYASETYLKKQDSTYNTLNVWDFLFNGVGFRNTFKKQEFYIGGLIEQVVPFGVGGYRHRLSMSYDKGFKNNHELSINPVIDYGFHNKDLKGQLGVGYMYNPRRFSKFFIEAGDVYDFVTGYQSIQGTFAPANRVRNRKLEIYHRLELINGLYFKAGIFYSNRSSIDNIEYPSWVDNFGFFSKPEPFEGYKIFMTDFEFSYHFRQKYILKGNQKIIIGSQWPVVSLQYKKGIPKLFGGQSDFDFMELRVTDEINLNSLGQSEFKFTAGSFLRKSDLRLIEHKYFRTSDKFFFSNPINSQQLLDTALNTANSYIQFNAIHHFNGFFLNKVWLLNRLKLEETVGGSFLAIPDAHFVQAELYAGIERVIRIRKQRFKLGVYAVTAASSFSRADVQLKVGINFYDSFKRTWDY